MKVAVMFFVLLAVAMTFAFPDKRFLFSSGSNPLNMEVLKADLQLLDDLLGSDPKEAACEDECHRLLIEGHVLNYGCAFMCNSFQQLLHYMAITEAPPQ